MVNGLVNHRSDFSWNKILNLRVNMASCSTVEVLPACSAEPPVWTHQPEQQNKPHEQGRSQGETSSEYISSD
jgi:hypothetical protein